MLAVQGADEPGVVGARNVLDPGVRGVLVTVARLIRWVISATCLSSWTTPSWPMRFPGGGGQQPDRSTHSKATDPCTLAPGSDRNERGLGQLHVPGIVRNCSATVSASLWVLPFAVPFDEGATSAPCFRDSSAALMSLSYLR